MAATCLSHVSQSGVLLNCLNKSYQFIRNDHVLKETVSPSKPRGSSVCKNAYVRFFTHKIWKGRRKKKIVSPRAAHVF